SRGDFEYELLDTGVFDQDRYFDVFVEYAKASPEDMLIRISVHNRGPEPASLHVLPTLWYRNRWSWKVASAKPSLPPLAGTSAQPSLLKAAGKSGQAVVRAADAKLGESYLYCEGDVPLLFTENETNTERVFGVPNRCPYVKDGINNAVVHGLEGAVNPDKMGT